MRIPKAIDGFRTNSDLGRQGVAGEEDLWRWWEYVGSQETMVGPEIPDYPEIVDITRTLRK